MLGGTEGKRILTFRNEGKACGLGLKKERGWDGTNLATTVKAVGALLLGSIAGDVWLSVNPAHISRQVILFIHLCQLII